MYQLNHFLLEKFHPALTLPIGFHSVRNFHFSVKPQRYFSPSKSRIKPQMKFEQIKQITHQLRDEIEALNTRVIALENRGVPITVREAMRILEAHICLEAAGSKRKYICGHYNFEKIRNGETDVQTRLATIMSDHGLTNDHLNMFDYLKDNGDYSAHHNRPLLTPLEFTNVLLEDETNETSSLDEEVVQENNIKKKLLQVLLSYSPCDDENNTWNLQHPIHKQTKSPVCQI
jgi:hypothetical protein